MMTSKKMVELSPLSNEQSTRKLFKRMFEHSLKREPHVLLSEEVLSHVEDIKNAIMSRQPLETPCYGMWPIIWSCLYSERPAKRQLVSVGAAALELCGHIGDAVARSSPLEVPQWLAIIALSDIHSTMTGEELVSIERRRSKREGTKHIMQVTSVGSKRLRRADPKHS